MKKINQFSLSPNIIIAVVISVLATSLFWNFVKKDDDNLMLFEASGDDKQATVTSDSQTADINVITPDDRYGSGKCYFKRRTYSLGETFPLTSYSDTKPLGMVYRCWCGPGGSFRCAKKR